ncbi:Uncharacterised protein [Aeromonas salmonicida]|nr:Uncharacterised protein [Aeromonas salmonicida]SUU72129.1 Uncharacterised protein [Aeromonas salmonicida]
MYLTWVKLSASCNGMLKYNKMVPFIRLKYFLFLNIVNVFCLDYI